MLQHIRYDPQFSKIFNVLRWVQSLGWLHCVCSADPIASFAPTETDALDGKVALEGKVLESIRAAQPDFIWFHEVRESRCIKMPKLKMCPKPSKFSTSAGLHHAEGSSTGGKARDASDVRFGWCFWCGSHSPTCSYTTLKIYIVPAWTWFGLPGEQDLLNRLLRHFARAPLPTPTQDLGVVCGFWFSTSLQAFQWHPPVIPKPCGRLVTRRPANLHLSCLNSGRWDIREGVQHLADLLWQSWIMMCHESWPCLVCFQVAIFVHLEWFVKWTPEGLLYLYLHR